MTKEEVETIHIIKPQTNIKYKKLCKNIYNKNHKDFINKSNKGTSINIHKLMGILIDKLEPIKNKSIRKPKYTQMDFIEGIIDVLNNNTYWVRYKGKVSGSYLNSKHNEYCKLGVYDLMYYIILEIYFKDSKYHKLQNQSIDTTFIRNLYGTELTQRNPQYKSKKGIKVSSIVDSNGVAFSYAISKGAKNDAKIAQKQINNCIINPDTKRVKNNNRYKQNIYADAGYDSKELIEELQKKGYKVTTDVNIRNTKDPVKKKKLMKRKIKYLKCASKRSIIERSYAWIHKYSKLNRFIEKSIRSYTGLLLLASSIIVSGKIY